MAQHYRALDGMRGVAALAVVFYHVANHLRPAWSPRHAYLAVDFFFMLSGFVIAHAYDARLRAGLGAGRFMLIRLTRLYPCVLAGILVGLVLGPWPAWGVVVANALLLPVPGGLAFPVNGVLWSLSLEIWGNLVYALGFRWFGNRVLGMMMLLSAVALWRMGDLNVGFRFADFLWGVPRFSFGFCAGVLLRRQAPVCVVPGWWVFPALLAVLVWPVGYGWMLVFPVLIWVGAHARLKFDRVWAWLGAISYPLYAVHYPVVLAASGPVLGWMAGIVALAWAVLKLYDEPVRGWLRVSKGI